MYKIFPKIKVCHIWLGLCFIYIQTNLFLMILKCNQNKVELTPSGNLADRAMNKNHVLLMLGIIC